MQAHVQLTRAFLTGENDSPGDCLLNPGKCPPVGVTSTCFLKRTLEICQRHVSEQKTPLLPIGYLYRARTF